MPHFYTPGQYSIYLENFTDNISFFTFLSLFGEYIFRSSYPQLFYKKEIIKISLKFRKNLQKNTCAGVSFCTRFIAHLFDLIMSGVKKQKKSLSFCSGGNLESTIYCYFHLLLFIILKF